VLDTPRVELTPERTHQNFRQHGATVAIALATPHDDLPALEIDVLHAQLQRLEQAQARSIQERRHQRRYPAHLPQDRPNLGAAEHGRNAHGPLRPNEARAQAERPAQHGIVQEQQRRERLVLRRAAHAAISLFRPPAVMT
jgi:hypothetical protein